MFFGDSYNPIKNITRADVTPTLVIFSHIKVIAAVEVAVADGFHDVAQADGDA